MRYLRQYWPALLLTLAAFGFALSRDTNDGQIGWGLLLAGTAIAAVGFLSGSFIVNRITDAHDHS